MGYQKIIRIFEFFLNSSVSDFKFWKNFFGNLRECFLIHCFFSYDPYFKLYVRVSLGNFVESINLPCPGLRITFPFHYTFFSPLNLYQLGVLLLPLTKKKYSFFSLLFFSLFISRTIFLHIRNKIAF